MAKEQALAQSAAMQQRTANYRAGKGFVLESEAAGSSTKKVRQVTYKECFLRSDVIPNLITRCAAWHARLGFPIHSRISLARAIASEYCCCRVTTTSFAAEKATPGSESVRAFTTVLTNCLHGSAEWHASVAGASQRGTQTRPCTTEIYLAD